MVTVAVTVFGAISLGKLPVNLMPEFTYPTLTVRTEYPGTAPADVEDRVSRRIEQALAVTKSLREIHSVSRAGVSDVTLEFDWDTPMKFAAQDVRELLDQVVLPEDAERPILLRYDPNLEPILRLAVYGPPDLLELRRLAEEEIQRELETVPGVAAVKLRGGLEPQILIEVYEAALTSRGLDIGFVGGRLAQENLNLASGEILEGDTEFIVRTLTEFRDLREIESLVLEMRDGAPVRLRDVANVTRTHAEREVVTRVDGRECVLLDIYKEAEANVVRVAGAVRDRIFGTPAQRAFVAKEGAKGAPAIGNDGERGGRDSRERRLLDFLRAGLPADVELQVVSDQSRFVRASIREVRTAALLGGLLAVVVLFLFLRRMRPTLIVATSIPVSIVTTFAPMYLFDVSLNIMSLGGLALGIGMLVDNSIVVLESITRCREEGDDRQRAALRGVREVAAAVTASTLTTVSVFLPMVFVEGVAGQVFQDQALTVVFSLLVSLVVSLFLIPMLASRSFGLAAHRGSESPRELLRFRSFEIVAARWRSLRGARLLLLPVVVLFLFPVHLALEILAKLFLGMLALLLVTGTGALRLGGLLARPLARGGLFVFQAGLEAAHRVYPRVLDAALARPLELTVLLAGLAVLSVLLLPRLGSELIPAVHQGEFTARIRFPAGTPLLTTSERVRELESRAARVEGIERIFSVCGVEKDEVTTEDEGLHTARMVIRLVPALRPARLEESVKEELARRMRLPELRSVEFRNPALFSFKTPVEVEIRNENLVALARDAATVAESMREIPSLRDVRSSVDRGNPEIHLEFDREKLARYGLNLGAVQETIRNKVQGDVPTRFSESDEKIDILVRVRESELASVRDLESLVINPGDSEPRPLRDVATFEVREGPSEIRHLGLSRGAVVTANLAGLDLASATAQIESRLEEIRRASDGSTFQVAGQKREMDVSMRSLRGALLLAVFLVYLVMAALFESLAQPLLILLAIPLALLGVVPTLWLLDIPLSIVVFIGMIILAGIVVNNAIVLIDAINRFRRRGHDRLEAIRLGGSIRLRPILMTTATTVLGLLPLTGVLGEIPGIPALATAARDVPVVGEILGSLGSGEGTEIRAPLAITVIAGLIASTFLTLVVIPVGYSLVTRFEPARTKEATP